MILLHRDYLLIKNGQGQIIPCTAELVAIQVIGEAASFLDPEIVHEAAVAVLHYFKEDLGCNTVSVAEFSRVLEQALHALGVRLDGPMPDKPISHSFDLRKLASGAGRSFELGFFPTLRDELRQRLSGAPTVLRFHGLRGCVKQLMGAKRWSDRCQSLNDQIVAYLRACLETEGLVESCGLVIC
jgi:hypothetical protein